MADWYQYIAHILQRSYTQHEHEPFATARHYPNTCLGCRQYQPLPVLDAESPSLSRCIMPKDPLTVPYSMLTCTVRWVYVDIMEGCISHMVVYRLVRLTCPYLMHFRLTYHV